MAAGAATVDTLPSHVFMPGDTVKVRHELEISPKMIVYDKVMQELDGGGKKLDRVLCFWFDLNHVYQTQGFNYLDLEVLARAQDKYKKNKP